MLRYYGHDTHKQRHLDASHQKAMKSGTQTMLSFGQTFGPHGGPPINHLNYTGPLPSGTTHAPILAPVTKINYINRGNGTMTIDNSTNNNTNSNNTTTTVNGSGANLGSIVNNNNQNVGSSSGKKSGSSSKSKSERVIELKNSIRDEGLIKKIVGIMPVKTVKQFSEEEKASTVQVVKEMTEIDGGMSVSAARLLAENLGLGSVSSIKLWTADNDKKEKGELVEKEDGRRANADFEKDVLSKLFFEEASKALQTEDDGRGASGSTDDAKAAKFLNIFYNFDMLTRAALETQGSTKWKDDRKIQALKFSGNWATNFADRQEKVRRKVTSKDRSFIRPSSAEISSTLQEIQSAIVDNELKPCQIINNDQSGIFYEGSFNYQYVDKAVGARGQDNADEKKRITEMVSVAADGALLPGFTIIKCATTNADQSHTRVLDELLPQLNAGNAILGQEAGSAAPGSWEKKTWTKDVNIKLRNGATTSIKFTRPYLINSISGRVVCCQSKAWMDRPGFLMHCDLILAPYSRKNGGKLLVIVDNFSVHINSENHEYFAQHGIILKFLPKNMTDLMQVVDLIINGPLKAFLRRVRCLPIYKAFQTHINKSHVAIVNGKTPPVWNQPRQKLSDAIFALDLFNAEKNSDAKFANSIRLTFIRVGQNRNENGQFARVILVDLLTKKRPIYAEVEKSNHMIPHELDDMHLYMRADDDSVQDGDHAYDLYDELVETDEDVEMEEGEGDEEKSSKKISEKALAAIKNPKVKAALAGNIKILTDEEIALLSKDEVIAHLKTRLMPADGRRSLSMHIQTLKEIEAERRLKNGPPSSADSASGSDSGSAVPSKPASTAPSISGSAVRLSYDDTMGLDEEGNFETWFEDDGEVEFVPKDDEVQRTGVYLPSSAVRKVIPSDGFCMIAAALQSADLDSSADAQLDLIARLKNFIRSNPDIIIPNVEISQKDYIDDFLLKNKVEIITPTGGKTLVTLTREEYLDLVLVRDDKTKIVALWPELGLFLWALSSVLNRNFEIYDLNRRKIELKFWPLGEYKMKNKNKCSKLQNLNTPVEPCLLCYNILKPLHFDYWDVKSIIVEEEEEKEELFCKCQVPYVDDGRVMIECEQIGGCTHSKWYHLACLKLKAVPKNKKWVCPFCALDNSFL